MISKNKVTRNMITEDYVSFETAKLLKDKGFEQESDYATSWYANQYYKNSCQGEWFEGEHQIIEDIDDKCNISYLSERGIFIPAPTFQMAMKWLREVHDLNINNDLSIHGYFCSISHIVRDSLGHIVDVEDSEAWKTAYYDTHEEACEAAIKYCLEHLI